MREPDDADEAHRGAERHFQQVSAIIATSASSESPTELVGIKPAKGPLLAGPMTNATEVTMATSAIAAPTANPARPSRTRSVPATAGGVGASASPIWASETIACASTQRPQKPVTAHQNGAVGTPRLIVIEFRAPSSAA